MKICKHGQRQAQRRAIGADLVDFVVENGTPYRAGRGCWMYLIGSRDRNFLKSECKPTFWNRHRDRLGRVATVVSDSDEVVTTMHRYRTIRNR